MNLRGVDKVLFLIFVACMILGAVSFEASMFVVGVLGFLFMLGSKY